ncbi:polyprenyl synthetase family protein [bacterium SCSIO 12643]|nr:polyprenyl synthetase family protein [bacterium SCSIO 12643]
MSVLDKIKAPVEAEMAGFESKFRESMKSRVSLLDKIMHYIIKRKGKQMRPLFVFLSAKMANQITDSTYTAASLIELLHTATLVHDDVVDVSYERRGFFSINALWKNKIAVLVGDYLLSRGLLVALNNDEFAILKIVANAVKEMSEGELLQMEKTRNLNFDENIYYDIIRQKTATLIAACCAAGVASSGGNEKMIKEARLFGNDVGMAFQLKDDLFDFGEGSKIGKPTGIDIKEKKMTLPMIYALNNAPKSDRSRLIRIIKNHNENSQKVNEVIQYVLKSGGIEHTKAKMMEFADSAKARLVHFPDGQAKDSLIELVDYTINRKK